MTDDNSDLSNWDRAKVKAYNMAMESRASSFFELVIQKPLEATQVDDWQTIVVGNVATIIVGALIFAALSQPVSYVGALITLAGVWGLLKWVIGL